jgi:hypothetical protein
LQNENLTQKEMDMARRDYSQSYPVNPGNYKDSPTEDYGDEFGRGGNLGPDSASSEGRAPRKASAPRLRGPGGRFAATGEAPRRHFGGFSSIRPLARPLPKKYVIP